MSREYLYGANLKPALALRSGHASGPRKLHGRFATGRVTKLLTGQGYGFIRLANEREVFFHRADLEEGTGFNDLHVGDAVTFELFEDAISGARALHVARRNRPQQSLSL